MRDKEILIGYARMISVGFLSPDQYDTKQKQLIYKIIRFYCYFER